MHSFIRTSLVLGLGAIAVVATADVPAYAAEALQPQPHLQQFLFKPDIRVVYRPITETAMVTTWNWKIENIGAADSGPITVQATCDGDAITGTKVIVAKVLPGLKADQSTWLSYKCPGGLKSSVHTNVSVGTQDDLDPNNNMAERDND